jgi:hypothetical protein
MTDDILASGRLIDAGLGYWAGLTWIAGTHRGTASGWASNASELLEELVLALQRCPGAATEAGAAPVTDERISWAYAGCAVHIALEPCGERNRAEVRAHLGEISEQLRAALEERQAWGGEDMFVLSLALGDGSLALSVEPGSA